jgi:hypothetical protein
MRVDEMKGGLAAAFMLLFGPPDQGKSLLFAAWVIRAICRITQETA